MRCARGSVTGAPASRAARNRSGQPRRMPPALPRSFVPSADNVPSFRENGRAPAAPAAPAAMCPSAGQRRRPGGRAGGGSAHTHRPAGLPPGPLTCARCPGTGGSGPCGGSGSASAATGRGSPRRAASEHVRAPGMRAAGRRSALLTCGTRDRTRCLPSHLPGPCRDPRTGQDRTGQERTALLTPTAAPASRPAASAPSCSCLQGQTHLFAPDGQDKARMLAVMLPAPPGCGSHQKCVFLGRTRGEVRSGEINHRL